MLDVPPSFKSCSVWISVLLLYLAFGEANEESNINAI
jgi:hypothetical protein